MRNYWTCSKFADWIRGTTKPKWGTGDEWKDWRVQAQAKHPWRWWLAEEGLDYVQDFFLYIPEKIRSIRYYINNRYITHSHSLTAHRRDIKPGDWCDVGNRFLPCLFNELVDFIEIEKAWMMVVFDDVERKKKYKVPRLRLWGWRVWRSAEAGLDHLKWEMSLTHNEDWFDKDDPNYGKPTPQAVAAREQYELYRWWTEIRPSRIDAYNVSGWSDYCDSKRDRGIGLLETDPMEDRAKVREMLDKSNEIEAAYDAEDEEMLIRLIKIRNSLWT
jgi:hypothetical protein